MSGAGSSTTRTSSSRQRDDRGGNDNRRRTRRSTAHLNTFSGSLLKNDLHQTQVHLPKAHPTSSSRGPVDANQTFYGTVPPTSLPFPSRLDGGSVSASLSESKSISNPFKRSKGSSSSSKRRKVEHATQEYVVDSASNKSSSPEIEELPGRRSGLIACNSDNSPILKEQKRKKGKAVHSRRPSLDHQHQNGDPGPKSSNYRRSNSPAEMRYVGPSSLPESQLGAEDMDDHDDALFEGKSSDSIDTLHLGAGEDDVGSLLEGKGSLAAPIPIHSRQLRDNRPLAHSKPGATQRLYEQHQKHGGKLSLSQALPHYQRLQGESLARQEGQTHRNAAISMADSLVDVTSPSHADDYHINISDDDEDTTRLPIVGTLPTSYPPPSTPDDHVLPDHHRDTRPFHDEYLLTSFPLPPPDDLSHSLSTPTSSVPRPVENQQNKHRHRTRPSSRLIPPNLQSYQPKLSEVRVGDRDIGLALSPIFSQRPDDESNLPERPQQNASTFLSSAPKSTRLVSASPSSDIVEMPGPSSVASFHHPALDPKSDVDPMEADPVVGSSQEQDWGEEPDAEAAGPSEHRRASELPSHTTRQMIGLQPGGTARDAASLRPSATHERPFVVAPTLRLQHRPDAKDSAQKGKGREDPLLNGSGSLVKERVGKIEAMTASSLSSWLSFEQIREKASHKDPTAPRSAMPPSRNAPTRIVTPASTRGGKVSQSMGTRESVASSSRSVLTAKAQKADTISRKPSADALPLKRWFWGMKEVVDPGKMVDGRPQWWIKWNENTLSVWDVNKVETKSKHILNHSEFSVLTSGITTAEYALGASGPVVLKLGFSPTRLPKNQNTWFDPVKHHVVFEFDHLAVGFSEDAFRMMLNLICKHGVKPARVSGPGVHSLLEMAASLATMAGRDSPANDSHPPSPRPKARKQAVRSLGSAETSENELCVGDASHRFYRGSSMRSYGQESRDQSPASDVKQLGITSDPSLRRSARQIRPIGLSPVSIDNNELLFSYPPVNINKGDLARLEPGEFLNDTLIEFGLKMWFNDLEERHPEIAKDVWYFNSFFYKKLCHKNPEEGYSSVRKWTAKIDVFKKKFIIVPINEHLHWYLAVIYNPYCTLLSPPIPVPKATRASSRKVDQTAITQVVVGPSEADFASLSGTEMDDRNEVESSLRLEPGDEPPISPTANRTLLQPPVLDGDGDTQMSEAEPPSGNHLYPGKSHCASTILESDATLDLGADDALGTAGMPLVVDSQDDVRGHRSDDGMSVSDHMESMYLTAQPSPGEPVKSATADQFLIGDGTNDLRSDVRSTDDAVRNIEETMPENSPQATMVYILDSLGGKHPSVVKALKRWLKAEALDKKGVSEASEAQASYVYVPYQTNHVDCGVYLLHFAERFVLKHEEVWKWMQIKKNRDAKAKEEFWGGEELKLKRAALKRRVQALAEQWKASKTIESKGKSPMISSDVQPASPPPSRARDESRISSLHIASGSSSDALSSNSEPAPFSETDSPSDAGLGSAPWTSGREVLPLRDHGEGQPTNVEYATRKKTPIPERADVRTSAGQDNSRGPDQQSKVSPRSGTVASDSGSDVEIVGVAIAPKKAALKPKPSPKQKGRKAKPLPETGKASRLR
ncbi:hypothetical protein FRB98_005596 [Tulasnella sp. 332]|nr:hypothetical protein FRB98_005596 [Tulasnella sp. 332]